MLMRFCPRCKTMIPHDKSYCDACQPVVDKARDEAKARHMAKANKRYNNTKRNPIYQQFYQSSEWKTLRAVKLSQSGYLCEDCKNDGIIALAVDVHHIVPISVDWDKRLDTDNLKCLCVQCHNRAHDRWQKRQIPGEGQKV